MKMRTFHTMIRVGNIDRLIDFYIRVLGMTLLRKNDYPDGQFTPVFAGYGSRVGSAVIELTHNWGVNTYETSAGYGHIAIGVGDAYQTCDDIRNNGDQVARGAGPMKRGITVIALVTDSGGYKIELIQKSS